MMIPKHYAKFIRDLLKTNSTGDKCVELIDEALKLSTHLVRVRSVARAAGFCAFYGRMAEKMGVYEILEGGAVARGREVHRVLGLASLNLFIEKPTATGSYINEVANEYVMSAAEELKDFLGLDEKVIEIAIHLLKRLGRALDNAKRLLMLDPDDPLFPVVEQTLADYSTRMYGAPDLILENMEKRKAIVVEWKTYRPDEEREYGSNVLEFEKSQVIAYSILEARRLGIELKSVFECIAGVKTEIIKKLLDSNDEARRHPIDVDTIRSTGLLRVLPLIVTPSGGYPPHPLMYESMNYDHTIRRFVKLYEIFKQTIIAATYLALQIINIPKLLSTTFGGFDKDVNTMIKELCATDEGYLAYNYTPFKYLRAGRPGNWGRYPCKMCPFRGDEGPCAFYFGSKKPKDYFDKLMWWARYKVYWDRERDLVSHRAMYELFSHPVMVKTIFSNNPVEISVDIGGNPRIPRKNTVIYLVRVNRGSQDLGKFRFDYFRISDTRFDEDNNIIEVSRDVRNIEVEKDVKGFLRKSVYLTIIDPSVEINPLLSINTFVMIDEAFVSDNEIVYRFYNPSPALQYRFALFGKYLKWYKQRKPEALLLAYETPVDLTIMELRAIDTLHRYLRQVVNNVTEVLNTLKQHDVYGIEEEDIINEAKMIRNYIPESEKIIALSLYKLLRKRIVDYVEKDSG